MPHAVAALAHPLSPFFTPELVACRLYLSNTGCAWVDYGDGCSAPPVAGEDLLGKAARQHARYHLGIDNVQANASQSSAPDHEENRCCCPHDKTDLAMQRALCEWCSGDADPPECGYACDPDQGRRERQAQCEASELWLQQHPGDNDGDVLQSQREAQRSPHLDYEQNATSDVEWALLPASGRLSDNPGVDGPWRTCAVVGSSSSLLGHRNGELIDGHDQVIRVNMPVISGFEDDVGRRTTVQMFWGDFGQSIPRFDEAQAGVPPAERAVAVQAPSTKRDIESNFEALRNAAWSNWWHTPNGLRHSRPPMARGARAFALGGPLGSKTELRLLKPRVERWFHCLELNHPGAGRKMPGKQPLYMLSGRSYHGALRWLCNASDGGRVWHNRIPRLRPSTGFYAVAFALDSCSSVSLFGFGDEPPCAPHHYWDPPLLASECNASAAPAQLGQVALEEALQRDGVAGNHWFDLEHRVYRSLREQERLTMEAGTNQRLLTPFLQLKTPPLSRG